MTLKSFIAIFLLLYTCIVSTSASVAQASIHLHNASSNIEKFSDYEAIIESLYQQIRPRANVTDSTLSTEEIDNKVRKYILAKYAPALIMSYKHVYSQLLEAKKDFSNCNDIMPINKNADVLKALCIKSEFSGIVVQYMTNSYSQGWSKTAIFVFSDLDSKLQLTSIELQLKGGVKAYVEGI